MTRFLSLAIYPALGLLFIGLALRWFGPAAQLAISGPSHIGRVEGMLLIHDAASDVLTRIDTELNLSTAEGTRFDITFTNGRAVRIVGTAPGGSPVDIPVGILSEPSEASHPMVAPLLPGQILDMLVGNSATIERILKRERRRNSPDTLATVEKTERIRARLNLPLPPAKFIADAAGIQPELTTGAKPVEVVTRARFQLGERNEPAGKKTPTLKEFSETVDGAPVEVSKKDFRLQRESWRTDFYALVRFEKDGAALAALSDLGRRGQPVNGQGMFDASRVQILEAPIARATITGIPPDPGPRLPRLQWFSRVCEVVFSRWAYPVLLVLVGVVFWIAGGILISLAVFPPRTEFEALAKPESKRSSSYTSP